MEIPTRKCTAMRGWARPSLRTIGVPRYLYFLVESFTKLFFTFEGTTVVPFRLLDEPFSLFWDILNF